tara:strand:- start:120 stop:1820 length:1701 start_codon:yes stop_codon:yes gene_type:complete
MSLLNRLTFLIFMATIYSQSPTPLRYSLKSFELDSVYNKGIKSNIVAEIRSVGDSLTWFGTGQGLALHNNTTNKLYNHKTISGTDTLANKQLTKLLPIGGIPAIAVQGDTMAVSFSGDNGSIQVGYGIAVTFDAQNETGIDWVFYEQPLDLSGEGDSLETFGNVGRFSRLAVTVPEANVTYDAQIHYFIDNLGIGSKYLWITSWAGGLRRIDLDADFPVWQLIPLPMDNQDSLDLCNGWDDSQEPPYFPNFYLNPRDPADGGNHNHKAFSVIAFDRTVWVGTANGINKGKIVREQISGEAFDCIQWEHFSFPDDNLSGNFVVALHRQINSSGSETIWAATLPADKEGERRGLSYSRDGGLSWNKTLLDERVYNITSNKDIILASSESGLWRSNDGVNWAKYSPAVDRTYLSQKQILTDIVYTSKIETRSDTLGLWVGTSDGVAFSNDLIGSDWEIFQANYDSSEFYAYPNPFSPRNHNQIQNDGYIRFHTGQITSQELLLDIFNFAMEKVYQEKFNLLTYNGAIKWNGKDLNNKLVANGVYFARLNFSNSPNGTKRDFWDKFIVVK